MRRAKHRWRRFRDKIRFIREIDNPQHKSEVFVYFWIPKRDALDLDQQELIERGGEAVAVLLGKMTPEEAEQRFNERNGVEAP